MNKKVLNKLNIELKKKRKRNFTCHRGREDKANENRFYAYFTNEKNYSWVKFSYLQTNCKTSI